MRKLIVLEHISLDGVIQAPGGPEEDPSGGFAYGGGSAPNSDPALDAFQLMIYPLTLGGGKRPFSGGTMPRAFKVTENRITEIGVIVARYERAGEVTTGSF